MPEWAATPTFVPRRSSPQTDTSSALPRCLPPAKRLYLDDANVGVEVAEVSRIASDDRLVASASIEHHARVYGVPSASLPTQDATPMPRAADLIGFVHIHRERWCRLARLSA